MVVSVADFGNEGPREQHNHGSGPFIGRDNYGSMRYELLDPKTRIVLAKLSTDAPDLAKLLATALRDGVISPDIVAALESAVRNINEDVAESLMLAGRNINEDVAESLMFAGRNINEDVANKLLRAADTISQAMHGLDQALPPWNHAVEQSDHLGGGSNFGHMVVTPPSVKIIDNWKVKFKAFFWGTGVGFLTGVILIYYMIKR